MFFFPFGATGFATFAGDSTGFFAAGDLLLSGRLRGTTLSGFLGGGPLVTVLVSKSTQTCTSGENSNKFHLVWGKRSPMTVNDECQRNTK